MSLRKLTIVLGFAVAVVACKPSLAQLPSDYPSNPAGMLGSPDEDPGNLSLVISQTQEVHEQIQTLLEQLRRLQNQQVVISQPFQNIGDNFFERVGVDFDFSLTGSNNIIGLDAIGNPTDNGNIDFNQGTVSGADPPFGGFDAAAGAQTGYAILKNGNSASFNFFLGQGTNRTFSTVAPVVTVMDGQTGLVSNTSQSPFVTSVIPVVGGFHGIERSWPTAPAYTSPIRQAIAAYKQEQQKQRRRGVPASAATEPKTRAPARKSVRELLGSNQIGREDKVALKLAASRGSSAGHGDLSVAEIRRLRSARDSVVDQAKQKEVLALVERARGAEEAYKNGLAKIYYRQAIKRANGDLKKELEAKLQALESGE